MAILDEIEVRVYRSYVKIPLIFFVPALTLLSLFSLAYFHANSSHTWRLVESQFHDATEGHLSVGYLEVGPTLTHVQGHDVSLLDPGRESVIDIDELEVSLSALMLFAGRLEFNRGKVDGARIFLDFDEQTGRLNLFEALGRYDDDDEEDDDDDEESQPIAFTDIEIRNAEFELNHRRFGFSVDHVEVPELAVFRESTRRIIAIPEVDIPHADFWFRHHLFRAPPERGDWEFEVRDFRVDDWRWVAGGFTVNQVLAEIEGISLEAGGRMRFPREDGRRNMIYDAEGTLSTTYQSTALEYFTGGHIRFDIPRLDVAVSGDFDEIDGHFDADARLVQMNGLFFEDISGQARMANRFITADRLEGQFYGAELVAENAFFNMLERQYGAEVTSGGLDPRPMMRDMVETDYPFLEGTVDGGVTLIGEIPREAIPRMGFYNYVLMNDAMGRFMQMEVHDELTLRRDHDLLFPNEILHMTEGSQFWVDQRRMGLPDATFTSGNDRFQLRDFYLEYPSMDFVRAEGSGLAEIWGGIDEIGPYATYYNLDGLEGPAQFSMTMDGFFGSPEWRLSGRMDDPRWRISEDEVLPGDYIELELDTADGEIGIERAYAQTDFGNFEATGWAGWYEPPPEPGDEPPWPIWEDRVEQPLEVEIDAQGMEMAAVSHLIHPELHARGPLDGSLDLRGTFQDLRGGFDAEVEDAQVRGQPVKAARAEGDFEAGGVRIDEAFVDLDEAGVYDGFGWYGYAGDFSFELQGEGIDFEEIVELQAMPTQLGGKARFYLNGEGDLSSPVFSGGGQARNVSLNGREYGDIAVTADTVDDVVHLSGGLLPWLTASVELPIDDSAPFYFRFGMEELALMDFLPELGEHPMLDDAHVTGSTELFLERDFSRYQAIFNLTQLDIDSRGQEISNQGPMVVGFNNGEVITFDRASFESGGRYFTLEGAVALYPALLDLRLEGDLDLALLDSARAGFPEFFPEYFVDAEGYANVDMNIRGTPENYLADGTMLFGPSEWELRFLQEPVVVDQGRMNFGDQGIEIPESHPVEGTLLDGATRVVGTLGYLPEHPREMDIQVWSHNMTYRFPDLVTMALDTNLRLEAPDWHDFETWLVSGQIDILDGTYQQEFNFVEQELAGRVMGAFQPRTDRYEAGLFELFPILNDISFDMQVRARDSFFLRGSLDRMAMNLEFRFDLNVRDRLTNPRITGDLDVIAGGLSFQGEAFDVTSGTVRFTDDLTNPYVDIQAGADVRNLCEQTEFTEEVSSAMTLRSNFDAADAQNYHIRLNLEGQLDNLDLELESNPYADQRDILSLLLTGCRVDELTAAGASRPTLEVALGPLLGRLEREIQDVVAVDEFTIMPGVERTQVQVGDTLTRRLSWRFHLDTGFADATGGQQYQLEYRLSDPWTAEFSGRNPMESDNFLLDLKLNYRLPLD